MKHNKFSKFIERILICLPLIFLGANILYISLNENAKDSYYGVTINDSEYYSISTISDLEINTLTLVNNTDYVTYQVLSNPLIFNISNVHLYSENRDLSSVDTLRIYSHTSGKLYFNFQNGNTSVWAVSLTDYKLNVTFELLSYNSNSVLNTFDIFAPYIYQINYNQYSFLNNTLPYAMNEFNKLGFGKIDFVGWFVNIFMNNQYNNVYVTFVNAYLNYFLFVECCYFIPMVFYWFIHFGERLVDRFTGKTEGW